MSDMPYRVAFRLRASDPWQTQDFTDRAADTAFQRAKRRQLWAAVVQVWSEAEQWWIG